MLENFSQATEVIPQLLEDHKVPGASLCITHQDQIVYEKYWGVRSSRSQEPVTSNTVFEAASMGKPLFAFYVLQLVEKNIFDLDKPLRHYLKKDYIENDPLINKITARMVLTHTSGLPNWREGGPLTNHKFNVEFEPGSKFGYSGEGFLYLQRVIEKVLEKPANEFMQELLSSLKMSKSSYCWETEFEKDFADWHDEKGQTKTERWSFLQANVSYSLYTTAQNYAQFLMEMYSPNETLLSSKLKQEMIQLYNVKESEAFARRSLSWIVRSEKDGGWIEHGGRNPGSRCIARFHPKAQSGIVVMTNGINGDTIYWEILKSTGFYYPDFQI